jgi:UDP-N-acetyl-D-mannosaminuronate dehydrogenase
VILTDHSRFDYGRLQAISRVIVDTRNAIKAPGQNVFRLGAGRPLTIETALAV